MEFKKFAKYVQEKEMAENKAAFNFDVKIQQFRNRFPNGEGSKIVKDAGYPSIRHFLHDGDERKWSKLKIPGQSNYVGGNGRIV